MGEGGAGGGGEGDGGGGLGGGKVGDGGGGEGEGGGGEGDGGGGDGLGGGGDARTAVCIPCGIRHGYGTRGISHPQPGKASAGAPQRTDRC